MDKKEKLLRGEWEIMLLQDPETLKAFANKSDQENYDHLRKSKVSLQNWDFCFFFYIFLSWICFKKSNLF